MDRFTFDPTAKQKPRPSLAESIAKISISELTLRTTIPASAVLQRIEFALRPQLTRWPNKQPFVFSGSVRGNRFRVKAVYVKFEQDAEYRRRMGSSSGDSETSPPMMLPVFFFGRVVDEENGAVIRGHFGLFFPILIIVAAVIGLLYFLWMHPDGLKEFTIVMIPILIMSVNVVPGILISRKGIRFFLEGLFYDVKQPEKADRAKS